MRFVRVTHNLTRGIVLAVTEQDVPFSREEHVIPVGEKYAEVDFGVVEDERDWRDATGEPCTLSTYLRERLSVGAHHGIERLHECPCTFTGINARLRAKGPAGIPVKVRAWLANILPEQQVAAMGIGRGLPISAMKAAEALRNRRDPAGGSRLAHLEGIAQRQSDARGAARRQNLERAAASRTVAVSIRETP
jgi:hypothetical protein